jgi:hypothetical protein
MVVLSLALASLVITTAALPSTAAAPSASPGSPSVSVAPGGGRPVLDAPVRYPIGPPPLLDTSGRPSATARRHGIRLDMWFPRTPVRMGEWLPLTIRVTNTGSRPLGLEGDPDGQECTDPTSAARLMVADLFEPESGLTGNAAAFEREILTRWVPGALSFRHQTRPSDGAACTRQALMRELAPGASFEIASAVVPAFLWRDQPLPSGTARVIATFEGRRPASPDGEPFLLKGTATVAIEGGPVAYPSPQAFARAITTDPRVAAFLGTRDLSRDWNMTQQGIVADPEDDEDQVHFADIGYAGGVAPDETVRVSISAVGATPDTYLELLVDPWDLSVEVVGSL